jgi:Type I phosphodiesterase / nucleotide pyrophosphatase
MPAEPVVPSYRAPGLVALLPALLGAGERSWLPPAAADAGAVVVLVVDGLGWDALEHHRGALPALAALDGGRVTTVAPSTTAAALTSITTGLAPSEHGLVGFRMRVEGEVLNALSWQVNGRRPPDPTLVQRHAPFRGREIPVVTKSEFHRTGFTEAHLRGARFYGWRAVSSLVEHCRQLVAGGEQLVYAYYPGLDEVAHAHGLHDGFYEAELLFVDRLVDALRAALPAHAALLVTADHGQVHLDEDAWVALGDLSELVEQCAGDGRFRYLYARRGAADELLAAARESHAAHAWVCSRDELVAAGWLGPPPAAPVRRRIGDVVLATSKSVAFIDPSFRRETALRSGHGSLTEDEMWVPLVGGRGTAQPRRGRPGATRLTPGTTSM